MPMKAWGWPVLGSGKKHMRAYLPGGRCSVSTIDWPLVRMSVSWLPRRTKSGCPLLENDLMTSLRVVPFFTCWNDMKCGDSVDLLLKVMLPFAGNVVSPRNRRLVMALTCVAVVGSACGPEALVTVNETGCCGRSP